MIDDCPNCNSPNFHQVKVLRKDDDILIMQGGMCEDCWCFQPEENDD